MSGFGIQCRTMLSQRPCGSPQCTREECSRAKQSAQAFTTGQEWADYLVSATNPDTKNDSTGSESVPQSESVSVSMPSLERLTVAHVLALMAVVDEHAKTHPTPTPALREAFRILSEAHLDSLGW